MSKKINVLSGDINDTLKRMTGPMVIGIIAMMLFSIVDTYYISLLGTSQLAAMGYIFPVSFIMINVAIGLGIGSASNIARSIGQGDETKIKRYTTDALTLGITISIVSAIILLLINNYVFTLLGAQGETLKYILSYTSIWFIGVPFLILQIVGNSSIRSTGDTKVASMIMIVSGLVNAMLDPLLIFGIGMWEGWGMAGAAVATLISWLVGFVFIIKILISKYDMIDFHICKLSFVFRSWGKILKISIPAIFTNTLIPISAAILTWYASRFGDVVVASIGLLSRIESLLIILVLALSSTLPAFVGQNWGAKNISRVRQAMKNSFIFILISQFIIFIIVALLGKQIAGIFSDNTQVIHLVSQALYIVPLSYGAVGITTLTNAALNAVNKPLQSLLINFIRLFILYIPLSVLGATLYGPIGIFIGMACANTLIGFISFIWIGKEFKCKNPDTPENKDIDKIMEPVIEG